MSFWGKVGCTFGLHEWSEWEYQNPSECAQSRRCLRGGCSKESNRSFHTWSDFTYTADDSCEEIRTCDRCGTYEIQMAPHDWGGWSYETRKGCWQTRYCNRCHEAETRLEHVWGAWKYASPTSCDQVRYCIRCNEGVNEKWAEHDDHQWSSKPIRIDCYQAANRCNRCGYRYTIDGTFHKYGNWSKKSREGRQARYCNDCGSQDERWL
jgi:hypothetical protein